MNIPSSPPPPLNIAIVGAGPAGLYFGILMKMQDPRHTIHIHERNRPGDTFGWGVVFSDATLGGLAEADPETYTEIQANFAYWSDIDIHHHGTCTRSGGHGFCGLARVKLLDILTRRAVALGCVVEFEHPVTPEQLETDPRFTTADLVLAADGVHSAIRERYAATFAPTLDWRRCKFVWLGTTLRLSAFTFYFRENEHGLFQVHAYPFDASTSTFIVECREEVWRKAGLDQADEAATITYMERLFGPDLNGERLLPNRAIWRTFPTIRNARWAHGNILLVGDAAHTAHFSIGSGTKLAMEDSISLAAAFARRGERPVTEVLAEYETERRPEVERIQHSAQTSLEWFENSARYMGMAPERFAFSLLTRSKRITWDDLQRRDPAFVARVGEGWAKRPENEALGIASTTPPAFSPYRLRDLTLPNRIVVSPMCQYSAVDGFPGDWHLVHLGSRAVGGAGLIIAEATAVRADGRITPGCTGIYHPDHGEAWARITRFVHTHSAAKIGLQIGHAGRKAACRVPWEQGGAPLPPGLAWPIVAPSAVAWDDHSQMPHALTAAEIEGLVDDFAQAAMRAHAAGFDWLELHFAHGYLVSTFLSALTNFRTDAWGGSLENRLRFPIAIVRAARNAWPAGKPMSVRLSTTEWAEGGLSDADRVGIVRALADAGADIIDCSAGGVVPWQKPVYGRMFQVPFSDQIRHEAGVPTMAVGNIQDVDQCNTILAAGRADLCVLARAHLADPYLTLHAAETYGHDLDTWPSQYLAVKPRRRKGA